jgi:hypothetical protein
MIGLAIDRAIEAESRLPDRVDRRDFNHMVDCRARRRAASV